MLYSKDTGGFYSHEIHGGGIPADAVEISDADYLALLEGQSEGRMIGADSQCYPVLLDPPTPDLYVPEQVSRAQGKAALITAGLWTDVLAYVEAITDPTEKALAEVALNDTTHWRRDGPTMQAIATALDISSELMDELFIQASQVEL